MDSLYFIIYSTTEQTLKISSYNYLNRILAQITQNY